MPGKKMINMLPLMLLPLFFVSHVALAKQPKLPEHPDGHEPIIKDREPNWEAAAYSCPLSIQIKTGEHKFSGYYAYLYFEESGSWSILRAEPQVNIHYRFSSPKQMQPYIFCQYEKTDMTIIIHAKDAIACGGNGVCWTSDPYTGKKKP